MTEKLIKSELAATLIKLRKANGLTQENVSEYLHIKRSTYAYYERTVSPPYDIIKKLATMYNIAVHELMYGKPDPVEVGRQTVNPSKNETYNILHDDNSFFGNSNKLANFPALTEKERKLIAMFRLLPQQYRDKVIKEIEDLSDKLD